MSLPRPVWSRGSSTRSLAAAFCAPTVFLPFHGADLLSYRSWVVQRQQRQRQVSAQRIAQRIARVGIGNVVDAPGDGEIAQAEDALHAHPTLGLALVADEVATVAGDLRPSGVGVFAKAHKSVVVSQ